MFVVVEPMAQTAFFKAILRLKYEKFLLSKGSLYLMVYRQKKIEPTYFVYDSLKTTPVFVMKRLLL